MARLSPSVQRVVSVLNLFADHPEQAFTLTDVIKTLKLSRATCHGLLAGLVEAGYLYRASDKSYVLGAALLHIGEMAKAHFSPLKIAQPEMRLLADEFDAVCSAAFRERDEVVVRERAAAISHLGYSTPRGARLPLLPQLAGPFFAGASRVDVKAWLDDLEPSPSAAQVEAIFKGAEFAREHGFFFCVRRSAYNAEDLKWLETRAIADDPIVPSFDLAEEKSYDLAFITAPVYDANRKVAFALALTGMNKVCTGVEVARIGGRVREACDRIGSFMARPTVARG